MGEVFDVKISRRETRILMLHEFRLHRKTTVATENINTTMGCGTVSLVTTRRWNRRFRNGNFCLNDRVHSGRKAKFDTGLLVQLIEEDPRLSLRALAEMIGCSHSTVGIHLKKMGKTYKFGVLVPHTLSETQLQRRVNVCDQLLRYLDDPHFLDNIITGDEKWILYVNETLKRQWLGKGQKGVPTSKPEPHPQKIMLSVWWGVRGVVYWELLPKGTTITSEIYCNQLEQVAKNLGQGHVYFLHDNARPHVSRLTTQKIDELGWTIVPHPPYSPDMAPTDFYLFRSLANFMRGKIFSEAEEIRTELEKFFCSKPGEFYEGVFIHCQGVGNKFTQGMVPTLMKQLNKQNHIFQPKQKVIKNYFT